MIKNNEYINSFSLASIVSLRLIGMFMLIPTFALYGDYYIGFNTLTSGIAIAVYGIAQAFFQIPMGWFSDFIGRKKVIFIGLVFCIIGSLIAGLSDHIYDVILGRLLQGIGAISAAVTAFISDTVSPNNRQKMMAIVGGTIGLTFIVSFIISPLVIYKINIYGIFLLTSILACIAIIILLLFTSKENKYFRKKKFCYITEKNNIKNILKNKKMILFFASVFIIHANMSSLFIKLPTIFLNHNFLQIDQALLYLAIFIASFLVIIPAIIIANKNKKNILFMNLAIVNLVFSLILLSITLDNKIIFIISLFLFFASFTFLESALPANLSFITPILSKGLVMGIYYTFQFLGIAFGGLLGGIILKFFELNIMLLINAVIVFILWLYTCKLKESTIVVSKIFDVKNLELSLVEIKEKLENLEYVEEIIIDDELNIIYLKLIKQKYNIKQIDSIIYSK